LYGVLDALLLLRHEQALVGIVVGVCFFLQKPAFPIPVLVTAHTTLAIADVTEPIPAFVASSKVTPRCRLINAYNIYNKINKRVRYFVNI